MDDELDFNVESDVATVEMPLFKWGSKKDARKSAENVNYKSKLEQKLLMARHDPEPIFDLTNCNLVDVPSGVYSWCKVCLKQHLLLTNNRLKSIKGGGNIRDLFLIRILELSQNNMSKLPDELGALSNLQALYLQFNQLEELPDSFNQLSKLQVLNIKGNRLKTFPIVLTQLSGLIKLDISSNSIQQLPTALINLTALTELLIDYNYITPSANICREGLPKIVEFLCQIAGKDLPTPVPVYCQFSLEYNFGYTETVFEHSNPSSDQQDQRCQVLFENEKSLQELYERLSESQANKSSFLKEIIESQDKLDVKLSNEQSKKDESRQKFLQDLTEVEKESNLVIEELLEFSRLNRNNEALLESLENERKEFIKIFVNAQSDTSFTSNRKEILEAMENTLENQYIEACNNVSAYKWAQKELLAQTQFDELDRASKLYESLGKSGEEQANLIAQLLQDEEYQKQAFATLMLNRDDQYTRLSEQISLIENELTNLTLLELRRQDLKVQTEKNLLNDEREILTSLLVQLLAQQENRSKEFESRVVSDLKVEERAWEVAFYRATCNTMTGDLKPIK
ncbi:hypothetical protein CHUAL_000031 [Chamberlinius hualienensis]